MLSGEEGGAHEKINRKKLRGFAISEWNRRKNCETIVNEGKQCVPNTAYTNEFHGVFVDIQKLNENNKIKII